MEVGIVPPARAAAKIRSPPGTRPIPIAVATKQHFSSPPTVAAKLSELNRKSLSATTLFSEWLNAGFEFLPSSYCPVGSFTSNQTFCDLKI